jgi:hypothetical protein
MMPSLKMWLPLVAGAFAIVHASSIEYTVSTRSLAQDALNEDGISEEILSLPSNPNTECGIWLAPSTIPGAGLGMYAGRDFRKGDLLQEYGDVVIPIIDIESHAREFSPEKWNFLWDEYTWDAESLQMDHEGYGHVNVASPGFGAAANSFLGIFNVEEYSPVPYDETASLHRSKDPGLGGFSMYGNRLSVAKRDISAGQEFFVSYGENWFETRPQMKTVPLFKDLKKANQLFRNFQRLIQVDKEQVIPDEVAEDLWDVFIRNNKFDGSRIFGAFHHDDPNELEMLKKMTLQSLRRLQSTRSLEWIEEHGTCGDHLKAGPSELAQAGRGAFASRFLPADAVVAHVPLIHISDRGRLIMYQLETRSKQRRPSRSAGILGHQILLNYCYGHGESTLLLCPYGPMVNYINHNATKVNVKLRWADPQRGNHMPELLERSIEELDTNATAKLAFELVALRDIHPGEEIYLDYGEEWEQAWQEHLVKWQQHVKDHRDDLANYTSARQLNADKRSRLYTEFDQIESPKYPRNVEIKCEKSFLDNDDWEEFAENNTIDDYLRSHRDELLPCEIMRVERIDGQLRYTVVMKEADPDDDSLLINHLEEHLPRQAIRFVDKPYTSDIFLTNAFRHDIRIPDEMFPQAWRNAIQTEQ